MSASEAPDPPSGQALQSEAAETPTNQAAAAQVAPQNWLDKTLAVVPRVLSSHAHIIFLGFLGVYLVLVKRERRRSKELEDFLRPVHARHDKLEQGMDRALAAAERAEAAVLKQAGN